MRLNLFAYFAFKNARGLYAQVVLHNLYGFVFSGGTRLFLPEDKRGDIYTLEQPQRDLG